MHLFPGNAGPDKALSYHAHLKQFHTMLQACNLSFSKVRWVCGLGGACGG